VSVKLTDTDEELITHTSSWPSPSNYNIESIERNVVVDEGKELFVDCNSPEEVGHSTNSELMVNVSNTSIGRKGITVRIYNVSSASPITFNYVHIGIAFEMPLDIDNDYYVTLNGIPQHSTDFTFTRGDIVEVTIVKDTFNHYPGALYIGIWANSSTFPGRQVYYTGDPVFRVKSVYHPAKMRLEVWSDAFA
jgi:hypothetical protein